MNSPSKRRYSSPLREEGARRTGELILAAAQDLFVAQGYVQTTIEQIAERAGVSRPTVFANAGSKRELLKRLRIWPWRAMTIPFRSSSGPGTRRPLPSRTRPRRSG